RVRTARAQDLLDRSRHAPRREHPGRRRRGPRHGDRHRHVEVHDARPGYPPPNVTSPEGEGEMLFTVSLKPGPGLGTTVCNNASIVFDFNAPIVTNDFCNT